MSLIFNSVQDMSKTMSDLWDREASNMEDIKSRNKAGIYGRLQRVGLGLNSKYLRLTTQ